MQTMFQPIPTVFGKIGAEKGGDMLGFDRFNETLVCMYTPFQTQPTIFPPSSLLPLSSWYKLTPDRSIPNLPRLERRRTRLIFPSPWRLPHQGTQRLRNQYRPIKPLHLPRLRVQNAKTT